MWWLSHHVRMRFSGHLLARIQVEELVHLWGSQSVSYLQVLDNKHLPRHRLIHCRPRSPPSLRVHIVLKPHLKWVERESDQWRRLNRRNVTVINAQSQTFVAREEPYLTELYLHQHISVPSSPSPSTAWTLGLSYWSLGGGAMRRRSEM